MIPQQVALSCAGKTSFVRSECCRSIQYLTLLLVIIHIKMPLFYHTWFV